MTLWNKGTDADELIMKYTVGEDHILDLQLIEHDCIASIAHAKMLQKIGVLTDDELSQLVQGLEEIEM